MRAGLLSKQGMIGIKVIIPQNPETCKESEWKGIVNNPVWNAVANRGTDPIRLQMFLLKRKGRNAIIRCFIIACH